MIFTTVICVTRKEYLEGSKGKNIWKGPRPEGQPESIPFQDPNRTSKDETNRTFILSKIAMLEG